MDTVPSKQTEIAWISLIRTQQILLELSRDSDIGLRQYEIVERVLLSKHNLSRLIDRLESEGLVKRQNCDDDGRGNIVKITKKGLQLKLEMWSVYAKAIQQLIAKPLTTTQVKNLTEIMNALLQQHVPQK